MVFYSFAHSFMSDKFGNRFWFIAYPVPVTIIGFIVFMTTNSFGPRYFSFFLMNFVFAMNGTIYAWISNAIPRPPAKRAVALAWINAVSNSSSIYASYMYPDSDAPRYVIAMSVDCVTAFLAILAATLLRFILVRLNKKLDRGEYVEGAVNDKDLQGNGGIDLQGARKRFRFKL